MGVFFSFDCSLLFLLSSALRRFYSILQVYGGSERMILVLLQDSRLCRRVVKGRVDLLQNNEARSIHRPRKKDLSRIQRPHLGSYIEAVRRAFWSPSFEGWGDENFLTNWQLFLLA